MSNPANGTIGGLYTSLGRGSIAGITAAVAQVNVADPEALTDLNLVLLSVDAAGNLRTKLGAVAAGLVVPTIPPSLASSVGNRGTVAAPGAGAAIVTIGAGALPSGLWDVQIQVYLSVAGTKNNMAFQIGATPIVLLNVLAAAATQLPPSIIARCILNGATAISVNAIAADAAGTYEAALVATKLS